MIPWSLGAVLGNKCRERGDVFPSPLAEMGVWIGGAGGVDWECGG